VPMAVWIDETGTLVRSPESASIEASPMRAVEITDDLPERMKMLFTEIKKIPDKGEDYRAAIVDWVENGAESRFAMAPHEVIDASLPRPIDQSRAAALFELGCHLHDTVGKDAAVPFWKQAHAADPSNWTYKRQAWTLESTPPGEASDMAQEVSDSYGTTWLDDVIANGGGETYGIRPAL